MYFFALSLADVSLGVVPADPIDVEVFDEIQFTVHSREDDLILFPHQGYDATDHVHATPSGKCWQSALHLFYCTNLEESDPKGARSRHPVNHMPTFL